MVKGVNRRTECKACGATIKERLEQPELSGHYVNDCPPGRVLKYLDGHRPAGVPEDLRDILRARFAGSRGIAARRVLWTTIEEFAPESKVLRSLAGMLPHRSIATR